ncbi:MAG: hypothetical protein H6739_12470 [Alphaproteobacteria bacterium]|nr:hypothetical protein [Alphaproteobacteria bacterium]
MLRPLILALGLTLVACGPSFRDIQQTDTIEAYEAFIAERPNDANITLAKIRLEELYLEKAREMKSLEGYDLYLGKYPEGSDAKLRAKALEEREEFLYNWADTENTAEAWEKFIAEYPKAERKRRVEARRRISVAGYADKLDIGRVEVEPTNLAEDPDGPLDGFMFTADVTNNGDKTIKSLNMKLEFLDAEGKAIGSKKWPLVAPSAPGNMPIEEEWKVPVKPGETRAYWYSDMAPEQPGWAKKARLIPISIEFEGEEPADEE